ncbi:MAG: o-succinylbenzoate synthase [Sulfobacillus acidophilus]|uniref:o-succinylbenzoate synthase n=1 Tax=Sulfobacillus acidophilus TaxID=53633 RepID=A0A2T2WDX2_9FIRM|nr:MAG: o-succinylbenzoate synthase [Sulfobacillus acidophilus]
MLIDRVQLDFVELPLLDPFETSVGMSTAKQTWLLTVHADGIAGYAESVADPDPHWNEETHATVYFAIKNHLLPRLWGRKISRPEDVADLFLPIRANFMAKATIEMAVWDWFARAKGLPLARLLGGEPFRTAIPVGVSIGIQPTIDDLLRAGDTFLRLGYRRLKVKIKPGLDVDRLALLREHVGPQVAIMADANSAYRLVDLPLLKALDDLNLMMLEQPLAHDDLIDHAALARSLRTPICLDESIRTPEDARKALDIQACRVINIKVGRVGGYAMARAIHDIAAKQGVPVWCGGMQETGIGRAHNLHLSTLANFRLPGDTSASNRYFAEDLVEPEFSLNPDGTLTVPDGPGIGVVPEPKRLAHYTSFHEEMTPQTPVVLVPHGIPTSF